MLNLLPYTLNKHRAVFIFSQVLNCPTLVADDVSLREPEVDCRSSIAVVKNQNWANPLHFREETSV